MMKRIGSNITVLITFLLLSFTIKKDGGNQNGCPNYNMANTDGVFTLYYVTQDFNFGQPAVDFKKYVAYFLGTRGDTTTKTFGGNISFSNEPLQFISNSNYYIDDNTVSNGNGNKKWVCSGNGNVSNFNYHYQRGIASVEIKDQYKINDTIKSSEGLTINLSKVKNADSIIVTISGFNGITINKRYNGLTEASSFSSTELNPFITGGIISVTAFNIVPETIQNRNYLFGSVHQYLKLVYFKNQ